MMKICLQIYFSTAGIQIYKKKDFAKYYFWSDTNIKNIKVPKIRSVGNKQFDIFFYKEYLSCIGGTIILVII